MTAANLIASKQFSELNGFQSTVKIPFRNKEGDWQIPNGPLMSQISPSVQIHFTGNSHWITSFQFECDSNVCLLDSLYSSQEIPTYVKLQLAQIYGKGKDRLDIVTPHVRGQVGGNDCGVFAIAKMVEFCLGNFSKNDDDSLNIRGYYDQDNLRPHLIKCLETGIFTEFNIIRKSSKKVKYDRHILELECSCGLPNEFANMIGCDNCDKWFHKVCVKMDVSKLPNSWICSACAGDEDMEQSPRQIWACFCCRDQFSTCLIVCISVVQAYIHSIEGKFDYNAFINILWTIR